MDELNHNIYHLSKESSAFQDTDKENYMKLGVIIGNFLPLHNGSLTLCKVAKTLSEELVIIVINRKNDPISIELRISWLKLEFPTAIIEKVLIETIVPSTNIIKFVK